MKKALLFLTLWLSLGVAHAQITAADSVAERKMIAELGADVCRQLEQENAKKDLSNLSKEEAQQLFARLMMVSAANNPTLIARFTNNPETARTYGEQMGRQLGIWLLRECATSTKLFVKMGDKNVKNYQPASSAEQQLLNVLAADACRDLAPRQKQLKALSHDQRIQEVQKVLEASFMSHTDAIAELYGENALSDGVAMEELGRKLGFQMAKECTDLMIILSETAK